MGERIKERREALGLTQKQFGELVHMDASVISHIEHGKRKLTTEQLHHFAKALRTTDAWLLHGTGPVERATDAPENDPHHLREENANLRGQLEESRGLVVFLKDMIRDLLSTSRGGN